MDALKINSTKEIIDKPRDKKALGCKWISRQVKSKIACERVHSNLWN